MLMKEDNIVKHKSFDFAVRIIKLYQYLSSDKKEFILSKQILRSGTSVGTMIRESEHAQSKSDFIHKLSIAQKEINEDAVEIIKLITSIIKTTKNNINN
ncbi:MULTISPECIES: four helix bundle protein [Elizabethkingia]|uniref:Four helix bundle protein n=2 Tax=Elizabethkingia anophelis TaxID=1117645 RepID=A0ABM6MPR1_9FLAO|nr:MULTISPECIES: four helix bundle protein [Elizabethkingia]ATC35005.1 four helix bundle protein [Elizabethkingia anophelis R26]ATC41846.1 four helix bundle protein [Elizabethkingia anophelis Ag1]ATC45525.1 four helix bundle protein [Elizabethkingia anophelis]ATC49201.1 four helix bundle protein [Elizabethkingia anophelis]EJC8062080.1 four helix bundle protein [Elizabethkingia anophelis]